MDSNSWIPVEMCHVEAFCGASKAAATAGSRGAMSGLGIGIAPAAKTTSTSTTPAEHDRCAPMPHYIPLVRNENPHDESHGKRTLGFAHHMRSGEAL